MRLLMAGIEVNFDHEGPMNIDTSNQLLLFFSILLCVRHLRTFSPSPQWFAGFASS